MGGIFKRILVFTAVSAEKEAVLRGLHKNSRGRQLEARIEVVEAGVGPVAAGVTAAKFIAENPGFDLVISAGIGGGFAGRAAIGGLAIADVIIGADLGVETPEGFRGLPEIGLGNNQVKVDQKALSWLTSVLDKASCSAADCAIVTGPIVTVSTATGSAETARELEHRVPGVIAEGMEGYGVALAAERFGIPVLEIRAISNAVGPRDRAAWKIAEALDVLEHAFAAIASAGVTME